MALKDLFRPAWKHSDPAIRRQALQSFGSHQADLLIEMALADADPDLRLDAAKRLHDEAHLSTVAANHPDRPVLNLVNQKLQLIWRDRILRAPALDDCTSLLQRIEGEELLADIVCGADCPAVRLAAVERVTVPRLLCRIAESACGKEPGELAVRKIADRAMLERLVRNGGNKTVRKLAEKRLKQIEELDSIPSAEDLRDKELNDLKDQAQRLASSWNWEYATERLAELDAEWRRLDPATEHPSYALLAEARDLFANRHRDFLARQQEEQRQAAERQRIVELAESILGRFEELIGSPAPEVEQLAESLRQEWAALPVLSAEFLKPLAGRFEAVNLSFARDRQELLAEQTRLGQLEALVVEAEQLAADSTASAFGPRLEAIVAAAAKLEFRRCDPALLRARLEAARQAADARLAAERLAQSAIADANRARLEELCALVEKLTETPDWRQAGSRFNELQQAWNDASRDGLEAGPLEELARRFTAADRQLGKWLRQKREEEEWERWANLQLKEELIKKVQALTAVENPVEVGDAVKAAQTRWKEIGGVPRKHSEEVWQRFRDACDEQFARTRAYHEQQRAERQLSLQKKEELASRAEALKDSEDWKETADELKALQEQWKEAGPGPHAADRALYERFRKAGDRFFERLRVHHDEQQKERLENLDQKQLLCDRAESLTDSTAWWDTIADLRDIRERWKHIGPAPHELEQAVWTRLQAACQRFFERLDQVRPAHLAAKQALCQQAEDLVASVAAAPADQSRDTEIADRLKHLQGEWKEIGPAPQDEEKPLWERFRKACDSFFDARRERFQGVIEEREQKLARKHELLAQARQVAEGDNYRDIAEKLKVLQAEWKAIGPIPFREDAELYQEFRVVCNEFFEERDRQFQERRDTFHENLRRKEALCTRVEQINGDSSPASASSDKALSLADQLRIALEENFILGSESSEGRRHAASEEIRKIQTEWKEIGPVPRKYDQALWRRYRTAIDKYYAKNRPPGDDRR